MTAGRMLLHAAKCLAIAAVLCIASPCIAEAAEYVELKVVHGEDGTAVREQYITIQLRYENKSGEKRETVELYRTTDSAGETYFRLPKIKPDTLQIEVRFKEKGYKCACRVVTELETVMQNGLVVSRGNRDAKSSSPDSAALGAKPGRIVFVARPTGLLERIVFDY